ncbi:MAG: hypothetical protein LUE87_11025 [Lachnospiraceae bacterium]|nr:hypothetical protein [Lachnospiraceae bacterium]
MQADFFGLGGLPWCGKKDRDKNPRILEFVSKAAAFSFAKLKKSGFCHGFGRLAEASRIL